MISQKSQVLDISIKVEWPGEFHPHALTDPNVNLSIHSAPPSHFLEISRLQANEEGN